ncbi:hypothetical protein [Micromonospora polyrhachis]|uniref:Uncharacterized protein n=1 Tax=Micromonospora polyrhachis TaxID=1282883 RepID=A0A7W7WQ75_9ACTN|nr:hypothetical protein [Micromonospora polyrhachis]MBB4959192.1 hypothetical protein [Micromonospora polyrhachis]
MTMEQENLGNGSGKPERFGGKYRGARRNGPLVDELSAGDDLDQRDPGTPGLELVDAQGTPPSLQPPSLPSLDLSGLTEPVFPAGGWSDGPIESLADHPLLRGLLLELPPKGTLPSPVWLDRWFEAARSILELLYVQDTSGRPR